MKSAAKVLNQIAGRTTRYDMSVWFWGDAIACDGLLEAAELCGNRAAAAHVERMVHRWYAQPAGAWTDYLAPGGTLLTIAGRAGDTKLLVRAEALARWLLEAPEIDGLHFWRPDLPAYRNTIWIDSLYHVPSFLAGLARLKSGPHAAKALEIFESHLKELSSASGPFLAHSWDHGAQRLKGYGWGRGQGWAILGMIDTLALLPENLPARAALADRFTTLASEILRRQDRSGFWRTLIDDPEAYLETSTAAFFGAAFTKGIRMALLDADTYESAIERAWEAMLSRVDSDGSVTGVSAVTWSWAPGMDEKAMYKALPTEANLWGQGAAMRFAAERHRYRQLK
jgi:unsaturated rhamnogalacturonyl hydrolase